MPARTTPIPTDTSWGIERAAETYGVQDWGKGYFSINRLGHVTVRPHQADQPEIDLMEVVSGLQDRGIGTPVVLRFSDLLAYRLSEISRAFQRAISENDYLGHHLAVYPLKVNQQRQVVDEIHRFGSKLGFGLEVGSKPELLAALGITRSFAKGPIICNGFKDDEFIECAVLAKKLGRNIIPVAEKPSELPLIVKHAERYGIRPRFGIRINLAAPGAGRWSDSTGPRSKFGLSISEALEAFEYLRRHGMENCLELLHCHMGSQIHDIKHIKAGVSELARVYVELAKMGAGLELLDIGGGLGVDYGAGQADPESSVNYTLDEYASDVVYRIKAVCDGAGVPHPTIVTECGRAIVAYHSVLVTNVLGSSSVQDTVVSEDLEAVLTRPDTPQPIRDLADAFRSVGTLGLAESYHDSLHARDEALHLFNLGYLSLPLRAVAEKLFWATCSRIREACRELDSPPEGLEGIDALLRDIYYCNFSLFQSVPDSWALRQLFPIMPIHRLDERPARRAILADITCDSDGKICRFPEPPGIKENLELHQLVPGEEYYLGVFLVGAYQETLGDLHNLFGDTHAVNLKADGESGWIIIDVIEGDTVREVLGYVQYNPDDLYARMRQDCEQAVRDGQMTVAEGRALLDFFRSGLDGYTYLEPEDS